MTINLQPWQIALILKALGKLPYDDVVDTIDSIKDQITESDSDEY